MKATFRQGMRYRTKLQVPKLVSPKVVLNALKNEVSDVVMGGLVRGTLTIEATWKGPSRVLDSEFILESTCIR